MMDLSKVSTEELLKMRGNVRPSNDLSSMSTEELLNLKKHAEQSKIQSEMQKQDPMTKMGMALIALGAGGGKGVEKFARGAEKIGARGIDYLFGTELAPNVKTSLSPEGAFQSALEAEHPTLTSVGEFAGEALPIISTPEAKLAELLGGKLLGKVISSSATGAALAPAYAPEDNILESMKTGAEFAAASPLVGKIAGALLGGGKRTGQKALTTLVGGTNKPGEISKNIDALETINAHELMPIGAIVESPTMHGLAGLSSKIPGSGQARDMINVGKKIETSVNKTMAEISPKKGESLSESSEGFINDVRKGREKERKIAGEKYNILDKKAKESGVNFNNDVVQNESRKIIDEIKGTDLESDKDLKDILSSVMRTETSPVFGTRLKKQSTFNEAIKLRKDVNQALSDTPFDNKKKIRHLQRIKKSIDSSLVSSAEKSGNPELVSLLKDANKHYRENVAPLNQKEVSQFLDGGVDPDKFIGTFLKTGRFERNNLINKVAKHLSDENKGKFAHRYLNASAKEIGGEERVKAGKILDDYMKLPSNAKKELLTDSQRKVFDAAVRVKEMGGGDLHQMLNPKTGDTLTKALGYAGSLTGVVPLSANIATKILKSPKTRNAYVKALKTGKIEHVPVEIAKLLKLGIPGSVQGSRNDQNGK